MLKVSFRVVVGKMLHQIIYASDFVSKSRGALSEFRNIAMRSRSTNYQRDVTGCLLFDQELFVQVLEGELLGVSAIFDRVSQDPRHENVYVIAQRAITRRDFPVWSMSAFAKSHQYADLFERHGFARQKARRIYCVTEILALGHALTQLEDFNTNQPLRRTGN